MAYSTQAPGDKQTHNQRQADIFNRKTEVFTAPLPEEIKQASACLSTLPKTVVRKQVFLPTRCVIVSAEAGPNSGCGARFGP